MGVAVPLETIRKFAEIEDPDDFKTEVHRMLGNAVLEPLQNWIVTATYIGYERTPGGIIVDRKEDIWQSPVGLVLFVGPSVCEDTEYYTWHGKTIKPGDWISFSPGNSRNREIRKVPCRLVQDRYVESIYPDPRDITG